jgi:hypothetical protein
LALALFCAGFNGRQARADITLNFDPTSTFSGTAPAGSLSLVFTDGTGTGGGGNGISIGDVQLKITSSLASGENVDPNKAFYLNYVPGVGGASLANLSLSFVSGNFTQTATLNQPGPFTPDGFGGSFPILLTWSGPFTGGAMLLTSGEFQTYLISASSGVVDSSYFDNAITGTNPTPPPTNITMFAATHVQNTPSGRSGSAYVGGQEGGGGKGGPQSSPEPSKLAIAGLGALAFVAYGLRKRARR